jgi:hypothetical protein
MIIPPTTGAAMHRSVNACFDGRPGKAAHPGGGSTVAGPAKQVYLTRVRIRYLFGVLLAWSVSFQAIAGVSGIACRHESKTDHALQPTMAMAGHEHHAQHAEQAQHAQHQIASDDDEIAPADIAPSLSGCGCGCTCAADCTHATHSPGPMASSSIANVAAADAAVAVPCAKLASHSFRLLRPPATL